MADAPTCPYCRRRPALSEFAPFCSDRCKMADLGRWLAGDYRVAAEPAGGSDDTEDELPSDRD